MTPASSGQGDHTLRGSGAGDAGAARHPRARDPRTRLLDAAECLLSERAAGELSVAAVCERAGLSRATFQSLFGDRSQLLVAVFDRLCASVGAEMQGAYRAQRCWLDGVRAALDALLGFCERQHGLGRFLIADSLTCDLAVLKLRAAARARLAYALDAERPQPAAGVSRASFGGDAVVGAVAAILHGRLLSQASSEPVRELSAPLMGVIVMPYLGVDAARGELSRAPRTPAAGDEGPAS